MAIILYPEYFDVKLSRKAGRRVPKKLAVENPNIETISKILSELKIEFEIEADKRYPKTWWLKRGRIRVQPQKTTNKTLLIREIGTKLKSEESR